MKNKSILILAAVATFFSACQKDNGKDTEIVVNEKICYVLNNGSMGHNNSNVGIYDISEKTYMPDAFFGANNYNLGDTGQDIIKHGEKIYIGMTGSKIIFVTDKRLNVKKKIEVPIPNAKDGKLSPRRFAIGNGKIYVTYYEGYLGEINPKDHSIRITEVGTSPEGLAFSNGKIYVANSGGANYPDFDNTVSVVDALTFKEVSKITVNLNPEFVVANADDTYIFVSSKGNYNNVPGTLQAIKTSDFSITDLKINNLVWMSMGTDKLYMLLGGFDDKYQPLPGIIKTLDTSLSERETKLFVKDNTILKNAYSLSVTTDGHVFVGCSDYKTNGDIYVFSPEGKLYDKLDSQGINPHKII